MKAIINIKNYVRAFPKLQWEGEDETFNMLSLYLD